jgi:biopolymer transport protein ExbB
MTFDLHQIFSEMGLPVLLIVAVLAIMALAALTVLFERLWTFARVRRRSITLGRRAVALLEKNDYRTLASEASAAKGDPLASLLGAGMRRYLEACKEKRSELHPVELTRRELERQADRNAARMRRGLNLLASVGSVAPFVGLLGTVVGIIGAFEGIASEGSGGLGAVSAGISEALVVTALGLVVAIPAVLIFNYLTARADSLEMALDAARGELIDHLESHHRSSGWAAGEQAAA